MATSLSQSRRLIEGALTKGRALDLKPLSVVVLDPRAAMVAMMSEDGVSQMRAHASRMARPTLQLRSALARAR